MFSCKSVPVLCICISARKGVRFHYHGSRHCVASKNTNGDSVFLMLCCCLSWEEIGPLWIVVFCLASWLAFKGTLVSLSNRHLVYYRSWANLSIEKDTWLVFWMVFLLIPIEKTIDGKSEFFPSCYFRWKPEMVNNPKNVSFLLVRHACL